MRCKLSIVVENESSFYAIGSRYATFYSKCTYTAVDPVRLKTFRVALRIFFFYFKLGLFGSEKC